MSGQPPPPAASVPAAAFNAGVAQPQGQAPVRPALPVRPPGAAMQMVPPASTAAHARTAELAPAAKKPKPTPAVPAPRPGGAAAPAPAPLRTVPTRVGDQLHESALYRKMVEVERKIDAMVERRKAEVRECLRAEGKAPRSLRLFLWNTVQPSASAFEPSAWTLHVGARLLDGPGGAPVAGGARATQLVRRLEVTLDPELYPGDTGRFLWEKDSSAASTPLGAAASQDGWELKRPGLCDCRCTVAVELAHTPERWLLHPALAQLLHLQCGSRTQVVHHLWTWIRGQDMLSSEDATLVTLRPNLCAALGVTGDKAPFAVLAAAALARLTPQPPLLLHFTIRLDPGARPGADEYEMTIDLPDARNAAEMQTLISRIAKDQTCAEADAKIAAQLGRIAELKRRRAFLLGFATSPADFINALVASQARDLEVMAGGAGRARDAERRSEFYRLPWVDDAIMHYLQRRGGAHLA